MLKREYREIFSKLVSYIDRLFYLLMISLVIFGVAGYISSQAIDHPGIEIWVITFIVSIIGALLSLFYFTPHIEVTGRFSIKNFIFGFIPYLVLLPGLVALLFSTRLQLSAHGPFHLGYIYQILNGLAPPENVVLPGYPANVYWLFHALIATLTDIFNTAPPLVAALVNIGALIISLYWIRKILYLLGLANRNSFITGCYSLLILFSTNLFGALNLVVNYILNKRYPKLGFIESVTYKSMMLGGDDRLVSLIVKFFNFSGAPLGIAYFSFAVYISILISKGELTSKNILFLAIAASGALMFHTTTGIYILLILPASILISLVITNRQSLRDYFIKRKTSELLIVLTIILILFIPMLHYTYLIAAAMPAKTQIGTALTYNVISTIYIIYPLIPLSLFAAYLFYRKKRELILFLFAASCLGYIISILFDLPGQNQYKFIYLTTIIFSVMSIFTLDYLYHDLKGTIKYLGKLIFLAVLLISGSSVLLSGLGYLTSNRFLDKSYYYENRRINLSEGNTYKDAFEWIRENTSPGTIIILPFPNKNTGQVEGFSGSVYIVTQRLPYVAYGHIYSKGIKEYRIRMNNAKLFYSDETPLDKKVEILSEFEQFSRERPSILLIPKDDVKLLSPYLKNLQMIYSGKDANIYSFPNE